MAALSQFAINITLSASVTNPINSATFNAIAPWGSSGPCATMQEAIEKVVGGEGGSQYGGRMGAYFSAQTLNGASGSGATAFSAANQVGP